MPHHRFELRPSRDAASAPTLMPCIDGVPLAELVGAYEESQGYSPAGRYSGLPWEGNQDPGTYLLPTEPTVTAVLACSCGEVGCGSLEARIEVIADAVIWSEFRDPQQPEWSYAGFGPFRFVTTDLKL